MTRLPQLFSTPSPPWLQRHSGLILTAVLGLVVLTVVLATNQIAKPLPTINSYQDCLNQATSRLLETFPPQCVSSSGQTFSQPQTSTSAEPGQSSSPSAATPPVSP